MKTKRDIFQFYTIKPFGIQILIFIASNLKDFHKYL